MSLVEQQGSRELVAVEGKLRILPGIPWIAPARQFVFPVSVPGEEEALQRGSIHLEGSPQNGGTFLAQCAIGFSGSGVANGLWHSPVPATALVGAGGYVYLLNLRHPEKTELLPLRPVTGIVLNEQGGQAIFIGYHHVLVCEASGELWQSERMSWEGVTVLTLKDGILYGTGWNMLEDEDIPFTLHLRTRVLTGGGYQQERG